MFSSPAYAQAAGAASAGSGMAMIMQFAPLIFIFVIFYYLLIRPQQKKLKDHRATIESLKKGDVIVTGGGVVGRVTKVEDNEAEVEIAPNVRIKVIKGTITEVRNAGAGKAAND